MYGMSLETKMRASIDYVVNFLIFEKSKAGSAANEIVGMIGSRMDDANTRYILRDRWRRKVVKCNTQPQKLVLFVKNIMQKAENLNRTLEDPGKYVIIR